MSSCPSDEQLRHFLGRELGSEALAAIESHVASCSRCDARKERLLSDQEILAGNIRVAFRRAGRRAESLAGPAVSISASRVTPSTRTLGRPVLPDGYQFVREISHGGQGVVYQAIQTDTKRKVAIKVLLEGTFASRSARRRFEREIELVASLKHPNIVAVFHSGQTADGRPFCVMDYVRGESLTAYVREKKLALEEALRLFGEVCAAVQYAHQKGVIHRDLKPSNILVDADGHPKVLDFGLAKQVGGPEQTLISLTGQVVGTLPYMSPEQARGNPDEIDTRTDVYALGVILYEMLTGCYPYPVVGQMAEVLKHIAETEPTPPRRAWKPDSGVGVRSAVRRHRIGSCPIDDEIQTIVLRALAKERSRRYSSAGELAQDVDHYLKNEPIEAKRDSALYVLRKQLRRYRGMVAATTFVVMISLAFAVTTFVMASRNRALYDRAQKSLTEEQVARTAATRESERANRLVDKARRALIYSMRESILLLDVHGLQKHLASAQEVELDASNLACYRAWSELLHFRFESAMSHLEQAVNHDSQNADAYFLRAGILAWRSKDFVRAMADLQRARQLDSDSHFSVISKALVQVMMNDFDGAIATLHNLKTYHDTSMMLWAEGFCTWLQLFLHAPESLQKRWALATQASDKLAYAAAVYRSAPMVFDVRTDLEIRMALIQKAMGNEQESHAHMQLARNNCAILASLDHNGVQAQYLSEIELWEGNAQTALAHARDAYRMLVKASTDESASRLMSIENHLEGAVVEYIGLNWALGNDVEALGVAQEIDKRSPHLDVGYAIGFITGFTGESTAWIDEEWRRDWSRNFGLWSGARLRGNHEAALILAERFDEGSLYDRLTGNLNNRLSRFLRGKVSDRELLEGARASTHTLTMARFTLALNASTREECLEQLNAIKKVGEHDLFSTWAEFVRIRIGRDEAIEREQK